MRKHTKNTKVITVIPSEAKRRRGISWVIAETPRQARGDISRFRIFRMISY